MNQYPHPGPPHQSPPKAGGTSTGLIMLFVALPAVIAMIGVLAVLSIYGVRKYLAAAKSSESKNSLGQIGKDAVVAFEERQRLCPSASAPVPKYVPRGRKYQSSAADWTVDEGKDAGFICLKFEMSMPQYYQYDYRATATDFTATARGDLDADGVESTFALQGSVVNGHLTLDPAIIETRPEE